MDTPANEDYSAGASREPRPQSSPWAPPHPDEIYRGYSSGTAARLGLPADAQPEPDSAATATATDTAAATATPKRKRSYKAAALIAAGLLVCGGGGTAIGLALGSSGSPSGSLQSANGGTAISQLPPGSASGPALSVSAIAKRVEPAVVDVTASVDGQPQDEGTGMIITSDGEVLTNNHVVEGATSLSAQINGTGRVYEARVLGVDPSHDVALIQLENASGLRTVTLGNSSDLAVGQSVVAIGNALALPGPLTVTSGTISALGRSITAGDSAAGTSENLTGLIQMDASINPGNSGGPLLNAEGQVIGMNTAAATGSSAQPATNVGFAIPINAAVGIVQQIQRGQSSPDLVIGQRGLIGVKIETVSVAESQQGLGGVFGQYVAPVSSGAVVVQVVAGTPAAGTALTVGDVIVSLGGHAVTSPDDVSNVLGAYRPGQSVSIDWVDSNHQHHSATIVLGTAPVQ